MTRRPVTVSVTLIFLLLNAAIWLVFGVIVAARMHPALPENPFIRWGMSIASFIIAGIFTGTYIFLFRHERLAWYITLGLLAAASLVLFFDDFGWIDLAALLVNLIPLVLLVKDRAWYLAGTPQPIHG